MKVIFFKGGLGNQMFQYVFYQFIKNKTTGNIYGHYDNASLNHNGLIIDKCFKDILLPKSNFVSNIIVYLYKIKNKIFNFNKPRVDKYLEKSIILDGYWQDIKYFTSQTQNLFEFHVQLNKQNTDTLALIDSSNSISVHIRRGDYLKYSSIYGNICTNEYYIKALDIIKKKVSNPVFIFFSDDIEWVKNEFKMDNAVYVGFNSLEDSYLDMYLMSCCKHNIISNSTFGWWGAYLNTNVDKIVICPKKWLNVEINNINIILDNWIKI